MQAYEEMYQWILRNQVTDMGATSKLNRGTQIPTNADITLSILSSHNNITNQVRYVDAIPTSLGDINFESTASGTEYIIFAASFRFSYFELKTVNENTGAITQSFQVSN